MTRDDIIRVAREAGIGPVYGNDSIERFATLVAVEKDKEIARLIDALKSVLRFVATQAVGCHGYKCREAWCWSCYDEEDAQKAAEQGADAADKAQALIRARGEA